MKKYLFLVGILLAGTSLQAAEKLTFRTVLSKAVGSFWNLHTTTCAYPDVSGTGSEVSQQTVINFGPVGKGGTITLGGGPIKVDTLLMEDGSELVTGADVPFLFAQPSGMDSGGKLTIFRGGTVDTNALLVDNLILPKNSSSSIKVTDTLKINWSELKVNDITLPYLGDQHVVTNAEVKDESGASFQVLAKSNASEDVAAPSGFRYFLYKE